MKFESMSGYESKIVEINKSVSIAIHTSKRTKKQILEIVNSVELDGKEQRILLLSNTVKQILKVFNKKEKK